MTKTSIFYKNAFEETQQAAKQLEDNLSALESILKGQSQEYIKAIDEMELTEAEKIAWNREVSLFIHQSNISVLTALLEIHKNKSGGTK